MPASFAGGSVSCLAYRHEEGTTPYALPYGDGYSSLPTLLSVDVCMQARRVALDDKCIARCADDAVIDLRTSLSHIYSVCLKAFSC